MSNTIHGEFFKAAEIAQTKLAIFNSPYNNDEYFYTYETMSLASKKISSILTSHLENKVSSDLFSDITGESDVKQLIVGVLLPCISERLIVYLGILNAGFVYCPLDFGKYNAHDIQSQS